MSKVKTNSQISHQRLKELLEYFPETGSFLWQERKKNMRERVGSVDNKGYLRISLDKVRYKAHRIAWFYIHGEWPEGMLDHIDGNKLNNKLNNLRDVQQNVNSYNTETAYSSSKTGFLGVTKVGNRFYPRLGISGKVHHFGGYGTPEEAHEVYKAQKKKVMDEITAQ